MPLPPPPNSARGGESLKGCALKKKEEAITQEEKRRRGRGKGENRQPYSKMPCLHFHLLRKTEKTISIENQALLAEFWDIS